MAAGPRAAGGAGRGPARSDDSAAHIYTDGEKVPLSRHVPPFACTPFACTPFACTPFAEVGATRTKAPGGEGTPPRK
eukprot:7277620-Prymnesium_polylepis.1